jgi:hypothetical protein
MLGRGAAALSISLLLGSGLSGSALGAVNNRAATRAYLEAELALAHAEAGGYAEKVSVLNELAARIAAECPNVAATAKAHEGRELQDMEVETATSVLMVQFGRARYGLARFVSIAPSLRWSSRRLTSLAHRVARADAELLLPVPNLCADWKSWVASGYSSLPSMTQEFLNEIPVIEAGYSEGEGESWGEQISHLLAPYEDRADRRLASAIRHAEGHETAEQMEAVGYASESVWVTLGFQQRRPNAHP